MNWNIPTILFHFHGNFQHKNSISKLLQLAYPSIILHESKTLFFVVYLSWGLTYCTPSAFRHARGKSDLQEHQAFVPLYYGDTTHTWHRTRRRQERNSTKKSRFEMMDSSSENCLKYWALSSCLCFLTWRGAKWTKACSRASFLHAAHQCNRNTTSSGQSGQLSFRY